MEHLSAFLAADASAQAFNNCFISNVKVYCGVNLCKGVQRFCLGNSAGKAVQNVAVFGVRL